MGRACGWLVVVVAACSGRGGLLADGGVDGPADGAVDAEPAPDASLLPSRIEGNISLLETSVAGRPELGQGLLISISFVDPDRPAPVYDEIPGSPAGCRVWERTPPQAADPGLGEGTVVFGAADGAPEATCSFSPPAGYLCSDPHDGAGTGGTLIPAAMPGAWVFADLDVDTWGIAEVGRSLTISGAALPGNNGRFPILYVPGPDRVTIVSDTASAETLPSGATWTIHAGRDLVPGALDPGFLEDDDTVDVVYTEGGSGQVAAFSRLFSANGDDFELDDASRTLIQAVPLDGSSFTIGCDGPGGNCGASLSSSLTITTTDAVIPAGAPDTYMPPPAVTQVTIRCRLIGADAITIPAEAASFLATSGATRAQVTFARADLAAYAQEAPIPADVLSAVGHAVTAFTTAP